MVPVCGDLCNQPSSVSVRQRIGSRSQNIPRSTREGVDIQLGAARLEVPTHCWRKRCILTNEGSSAPGTMAAGPSKPMVAKLSSCRSGKNPKRAELMPEAFQDAFKGVIENAVRGMKDQWSLIVAEHSRDFVRGIVGFDVESVNRARSSGWCDCSIVKLYCPYPVKPAQSSSIARSFFIIQCL